MTIDIPSFTECHAAIRRRLLEKCFWQMAIRPTYRQINLLLNFIMEGASGGEIHLANGVRAEKHGSQVILCRPLENSRNRGSRLALKKIHQMVPGPGCYPVPEAGKELILEEMALSSFCTKDTSHLYLAREKFSFPLLLRSSLPGELFHPCKGKGRKKISRFFNDRKIPAKDRSSWPVLACGSNIIALPGLQLDNSCCITEDTTTVLAIKWQDICI